MQQDRAAPWLANAWANLGVAAISGPAISERVHDYYVAAGHPEVVGDDVAWCAAFVGACLERAGVPCTRSLMARSYLSFGTAVAELRTGAVAVFSRGSDPSLGHVAFVVGEAGDSIFVIGGNQSNSVSIAAMPRAHLLGVRWPPLPAAARTAAPAPQGPISAGNDRTDFDAALDHVLLMEGGYSDDPYDPGGPTNLGITVADLAAWRGTSLTSASAAALKSAVQALTRVDVAPIYLARYWQPSSAWQLPAPLALFHFDAAVNQGLGTAARMLQEALSVDVDGEIGPLTLAAAASADIGTALDAYAETRSAHYNSLPTFWRFGRGWLARVAATRSAARALVTLPPTNLPSVTVSSKEPSMTATPSMPATATPPSTAEPKWWGQSLTIWGTIVATLATVLPIAGPLLGFEISADTVHQLGDGVVHTAQALGGVVGILMTIVGRMRAVQPLMRRDFLVKL